MMKLASRPPEVRPGATALRFLALLAISVILAAPALAQGDCAIARDYDSLAEQADIDFQDDVALDYRRRAAALCPDHSRLQGLGELAMKFGDTTLDRGCAGDDAQRCPSGYVAAAQAFIDALPLASDSHEAAASIGRYAQVLYLEGDPQKANNYVSRALSLDPENAWIKELAAQILTQMNSKEALRSGLGDFKVPEMVIASLGVPAAGGTAPAGNAETAGTSRTDAINLPLNFLVNSTRLDAASESRIRDLVEILAEDPERRYHIIGHADATGEESWNQTLSEQRAQTIATLIEVIEPSLRGRLSYEGRGASRPLRRGSTDEDHRVNRRVEVFVR